MVLPRASDRLSSGSAPVRCRAAAATVPRIDYELGVAAEALDQAVRGWAENHVWQIVDAQQAHDAARPR